jgi:hypothetical protein
MSDKPGRNDPCHCGSGAKYKKCHLEQDEAARASAASAQAAAAAAAAASSGATPRSDRPVQQQAPKPTAANRKMPAASRRRSV